MRFTKASGVRQVLGRKAGQRGALRWVFDVLCFTKNARFRPSAHFEMSAPEDGVSRQTIIRRGIEGHEAFLAREDEIEIFVGISVQ